tara:strand:- start:674 stop:1387 length:714 start_codon:yes stop_codon:yes gene_type:complete
MAGNIITPGTAAAGSVVTAQLANDSVDATKIDFGTGANQVDTDVLPEGSSNLYHTSERVDDRVNALLQAGANITLTYDDSANTLTIAGVEDNLSNNDTDDLSEGSTNLYFTNARADARAKAAVLVNNHSGNTVIGSDANFTINAGTDAGEFFFVDAPQSFLGISGVGLQFDFATGTPNTAKISAYGATEIEIDDKLKVDGHLEVTGAQIDFTALPTSNPSVAGRLWNDSGTVKISAG